jgi:putative transposase
MISFKGAHFPKDVILYAVFFYVRYFAKRFGALTE